jgi:alcohol dehydrogenase
MRSSTRLSVRCGGFVISASARGRQASRPSAPAIAMSKVIAHELEILGSHGLQAHRYDALFAMIESGKLQPEKLIGRTITLEQAIDALVKMDRFEVAGVSVVTEF